MGEIFDLIIGGLSVALQWENLVLVTAGALIGLIAGSMPGLSAGNTCAMLLPIAINFSMEGGLIFMASIYMCVQYGGCITAVLINTPGGPGAIATTMDGYPLTQQGRAGFACGLGLGASMVGGIFAVILTLFVMKPISVWALRFGTPELFLLALVGISIIVVISERSPVKGGLVGAVGLLIAAMGVEPIFGTPRLTFGFYELFEGMPGVATLCGFFAFGSMISLVGGEKIAGLGSVDKKGVGIRGVVEGVLHSFKYRITLIRASIIGFVIGVLPGAGVGIAALISYAQAQTWSKNKDNFGKGEPEGLVAAESADNACAPGALIPTFLLGIPGSVTTSIMLAALTMKGVTPGPRIMERFPNEVYAVIVSILFSLILMVVLGIFYTALVSKIASVNMAYVVPVVMALCMCGSFGTRQLMFDSYLFLIFGLIGWIMRSSGYMYTAMSLGIIMGKLTENNFTISLQLSGGSYGIFFKTMIAKVIWGFLLVSLAYTPLKKLYDKNKSTKAAKA